MTESTITATAAECRIYVACLASYNAGRLYGRWIDVDGKSGEELQQEVNELLRGSPCPNVERVACAECGHIQDAGTYTAPFDPESYQCEECGHESAVGPFPSAEEWAIHDHEGFAGAIGEYTPLDDVAALAEALQDDDDKARGLRFLIFQGFSIADAIEKAGDVIMQEGNAKDAVESYHEEMGLIDELPEWARHYIDFESIARDWQASGDLVEWDDSDGTQYCIMNNSSI